MTSTYYRLLDAAHDGVIVKTDGRLHYEYDPVKGWVRSGILLHYEWPESETYGMYEEITEAQANKAINQ